MFDIQWRRKAYKQLMDVGQVRDRQAIFAAVGELKHFPECPNVKKLTNAEFGYRLRVGRYRVLFDIATDVRIISIEEVKKRDEHTY